jgi:hypothetical protein
LSFFDASAQLFCGNLGVLNALGAAFDAISLPNSNILDLLAALPHRASSGSCILSSFLPLQEHPSAGKMAEASTSSLSAEQRESMNAKRLAGALPLRLRNKIGRRAKGS